VEAARAGLAVAGEEALPLGDCAGLRRGQTALKCFQRQLRQMQGYPQASQDVYKSIESMRYEVENV